MADVVIACDGVLFDMDGTLVDSRQIVERIWRPWAAEHQRFLVAAEDVRDGKPAPDGYLLAAEQLGISPGRSIVLEDTPSGVDAGLSAGAVVIGMRTTFATLDRCAVLVSDLTTVHVDRSADGSLRLVIEGRSELG